jgi:hypothetical protein
MMPGGAGIKQKLFDATRLRPEDFEYRRSADCGGVAEMSSDSRQ